MKITFYGAARMVTGSCYLLEAAGKRILVDCGMRQGQDDNDMPNEELEFNPASIDALIVTHAHIDHSGRVPLLCKRGYKGPIFTTRITGELMSIMLMDSARIQESDAEYKNQKGKRSGARPVEPLYSSEDVSNAVQKIKGSEYGEKIKLFEGIQLRFTDAGHLLGSASAELFICENGENRKIVFSGDIGNLNQPIVRDPQFIDSADYVVMESTYGDRNHEPPVSYTGKLAEIMDETFAKGGNVIIPSFAVGRTQELLYFIREIKEKGLVRSFPQFPVYVDSPLAGEATAIYSGNLEGFVDTDAEKLLEGGGRMFAFDGLRLSVSTDESKALNADNTPKVIISASGMCDAGRIRHHLKHNLWRPECSVVFVGYQSPGTLGRILLDGADSVKLFGEEISVRVRIERVDGMSAHADKDGLLKWIGAVSPKPKQVFVTHGDFDVSEAFAETLRETGFKAHAPEAGEVYDLTEGTVVIKGLTPVPSKSPQKAAEKETPAFRRLLAAAKQLLDVVAHNKGGTNKDLGAFADQILSLNKKWDR